MTYKNEFNSKVSKADFSSRLPIQKVNYNDNLKYALDKSKCETFFNFSKCAQYVIDRNICPILSQSNIEP